MPSPVLPELTMLQKPANTTNTTNAKQPKWKRKLCKEINEPAPQLFLGALLMLSLFMSDSWILGNAPDSTNDGLYGTLTAVFCIFVIEMAILCVVQVDYFPGFFFWMDFVGTLSIILDIGWIANLFIPNGAVSGSGSVLRATRAAKLGARYGRLLRLMKLMKFTRFLPCFRLSADGDFEPTMSAIKRVSERLSAVLSLRTALLVMILVIVVPFLNYTVTDFSPNAWIDNIKIVAKNETTTEFDIENLARKCKNFYEPKDDNLRFLKIESPWIEEPFERKYKTRDVLRNSNKIKYASKYYVDNDILLNSGNPFALQYLNDAKENGRDDKNGKTEFRVRLTIDNTYENQQTAMFGIILIVMVIFLLFAFTASFSSQVNKLVVQPLEKLMSTLRNSAMLMLQSMKAVESAQKEDEDESKKKDGQDDEAEDEDDAEMETAMLEKMVEKLARIVKTVVPAQNEIEVDENIDKTTSNWLAQQYTSNTKKRDIAQATASNRIDGELEKKRLAALDESLTIVSKEKLQSWDFNVLEFSNEDLCQIITYIFNLLGLIDEFKVDRAKFHNFMGEVSGRYLSSNTYHNFKHGCDVCHTSYRLLVLPQLHVIFSNLEVFSVLVGALAHDIGHPGINNAYLVKAKHELALQHNDKSPLENMHCVVLYEILSKDKFNIMEGLSESEWREARKIILTIILGTDMTHHFEQISKTQLFFEVNGDDVRSYCSGASDQIECFADEKNRHFIMELVLHCSDINNPLKPFKLCSKWADLVVEEFCLQGDREKKEGLEVSPMCDRDAVNLCNMQMGFIEFVVAPLIIAFVKILPPLHEIGGMMLNNFESWGNRRIRELTDKREEGTAASESDDPDFPDVSPASYAANYIADAKLQAEEVKKVEDRQQKFRDRMAFLDELKSMPKRPRTSLIGKAGN